MLLGLFSGSPPLGSRLRTPLLCADRGSSVSPCQPYLSFSSCSNWKIVGDERGGEEEVGEEGFCQLQGISNIPGVMDTVFDVPDPISTTNWIRTDLQHAWTTNWIRTDPQHARTTNWIRTDLQHTWTTNWIRTDPQHTRTTICTTDCISKVKFAHKNFLLALNLQKIFLKMNTSEDVIFFYI